MTLLMFIPTYLDLDKEAADTDISFPELLFDENKFQLSHLIPDRPAFAASAFLPHPPFLPLSSPIAKFNTARVGRRQVAKETRRHRKAQNHDNPTFCKALSEQYRQ